MNDELLAAAKAVLRSNDAGHLVKAGPKLYPHQWSWDAAFNAIGLAHLDPQRAITEWQTLFSGQWSTGMLPHIVFADDPDYFPGFDVWGTQPVPARPSRVATSGISQPPVHAYCLLRTYEVMDANGAGEQARDFIAEAVARLAVSHAWFQRVRMNNPSGLIEIHHGWESGMDNSPRFDSAYANVVPPFEQILGRTDLKYAAGAQRPTDEDYQRYIWLIMQMRSVNFDDERLAQVMDFRVGDVFMTACLALSAQALEQLANIVGDQLVASESRECAARARRAVLASVDEQGLCRDFDIRTGQWSRVRSLASFSALLCGGDARVVAAQRHMIMGKDWMGHPDNAFRLPGSTSLNDPQVQPSAYWRGPVWPIMNWFFARRALDVNDQELAQLLRSEGLAELGDQMFAEYYHPVSVEPLGSPHQSWSAMAAIDWLVNPVWHP